MIALLSPYLLTTGDPAAYASLLLADQTVTVVPSPEGMPTREAVGEAAGRVPQYLQLLESWSWSMPLWHAGVVASDFGGEDAIGDIRDIRREIETDDSYAPLRPLMHAALEQTDDIYLQRFAADLLKGGPDPALSVPVAAGIDRFAARTGLVVVRAEPVSVVAQHESRMMTEIVKCAVPVLVRGGGLRLLAAREDLEPLLNDLRDAIDSAEPAGVRAAAAEYTDAFEAMREDLTRITDPDEPRPSAGMVAVTLAELPEEAVRESSCAAAGRMLGSATGLATAPTGAIVRTLVIRQIGGRPRLSRQGFARR